MSTDPVSTEQVSTEQAGPAEIVAAAAQMRVVRGAPDDLEVAALVAGLVAVASGAEAVEDVPETAQWVRRSRPAPELPAGGDSWRWSLR